MLRTIMAIVLLPCLAMPIIIDRVAIVVDSDDIIKDSDITRDLHATEFLNGEPPGASLSELKKTASHLIDQVFIRQEIRIADYPIATTEEANRELQELQKRRFKSEDAMREDLKRYDLSLPDLREQFRWQLTVLQFIDARFKPAVLINDDAVDRYYKSHLGDLRKESPKASEEDLRAAAREILTAEEVNKLFFAWLDQHRHSAKVRFLEQRLS